MLGFKDRNTFMGLGLVLLYSAAAVLGGMNSELYILTYIALPACFVFLYVNFGKKTGLGLSLGLALVSAMAGGLNSITYASMYSVLAFIIYYIMGFEGQQFKKFSLSILAALLLLIGSFAVLDYASAGPGFIEELNLLMKNPEFVKQLSTALAKSSPGSEILIADQNMIKLAISTLLPLFLFMLAITVSVINYSLINIQRRKSDKTIEAVAPLWRLCIPYPLVFSLVLIGMLGMMMPDIEKSFGGGLFISAFLLNSTLFVFQGLFLLAFLLHSYGLNPKYITPLCILIFVISLLLGLGLVISLLLYAGLIDLIFDIRRLRKRG